MDGPWDRITDSLIPGLGSSPDGARYGYHDVGLLNGVTYYYQLEDVETTGVTERHGPVSATPHAGVVSDPPSDDPEPDDPADLVTPHQLHHAGPGIGDRGIVGDRSPVRLW